jgi:hypothetical protein
MFEEEFLNNVMERYSIECDEDTYRKISVIFVEEHLKLLKQYEMKIKSQIEEITRMYDNLKKGAA